MADYIENGHNTIVQDERRKSKCGRGETPGRY